MVLRQFTHLVDTSGLAEGGVPSGTGRELNRSYHL